MRTEIGSEFWSALRLNEINGLFPEETVWFQSGRSALSYIIADIMCKYNVKTVGMPSWCCESMIRPFVANGLEICFYDVYVDETNAFIQNVNSAFHCDVLLLMDYFGFGQGSEVPEYKGIVIRDITHSLLGMHSRKADYCFGSLRKWCGIATGGFAYSTKEWSDCNIICPADSHYVELRKCAMEKKAGYIKGFYNDKGYLDIYRQAEQYLEKISDAGIFGASLEDVESAQRIDVCEMRERRRRNAKVLMEELKDIILFSELDFDDCPLFVPIVVPKENRAGLRNKLIEKEIYCPIHWPLSALHQINAVAQDIYEREISLVCDQRYEAKDMERLAYEIKKYLGV